MTEAVFAASPSTGGAGPSPRAGYRRLGAVLALLLGILALVGPTAGAVSSLRSIATAEDPLVTFGLTPAQIKDQPFRANFDLEMTPGQVIRDSVRIRNFSSERLELNVYGTDAFNAANGAVDLLPGATDPKDAGTWITLEKESLSLASNDFADVPFTLRVPATGVEPGDHIAGIVASYLGETTAADGQVVKLDRRIGTRVQVRIAGELTPQLVISNLKTRYDGTWNPIGRGSMDVSYRVTNVGNVRMGVDQQIKISSPIGFPSTTVRPAPLTDLLPGNTVEVTEKVSGVWPTFRANTKVALTPIASREGDTFPPNVAASAKAGNWAIPWATILLLIVLAIAWKLRQRRRQLQQDSSARELEAMVDARLGGPADTAPATAGRAGSGHAPNGHAPNGQPAPGWPADTTTGPAGGRTAP